MFSISGIKPISDPQLRLWDEPLGNHGHVRIVIGDFVEELTALLFDGVRHKTDSTKDYCPDVSVPQLDLFLECKAAGRSNETFVYSGRMERDATFAETNRLFYVIWHHTANTMQARTVNELKSLLLSRLQSIYIVPFGVIEFLSLSISDIVKLNSHYGLTNGDKKKEYGSGYRIKLSKLADYKFMDWQVENTWKINATEMV